MCLFKKIIDFLAHGATVVLPKIFGLEYSKRSKFLAPDCLDLSLQDGITTAYYIDKVVLSIAAVPFNAIISTTLLFNIS